jgi:hypothetical protein
MSGPVTSASARCELVYSVCPGWQGATPPPVVGCPSSVRYPPPPSTVEMLFVGWNPPGLRHFWDGPGDDLHDNLAWVFRELGWSTGDNFVAEFLARGWLPRPRREVLAPSELAHAGRDAPVRSLARGRHRAATAADDLPARPASASRSDVAGGAWAACDRRPPPTDRVVSLRSRVVRCRGRQEGDHHVVREPPVERRGADGASRRASSLLSDVRAPNAVEPHAATERHRRTARRVCSAGRGTPAQAS